MSNNIAIKVEHLSKCYRIGQYVGSGAQYKTLRESLTNAVSAPLRRLKSISKFEIRNSKSDTPQSDRFIWALKDVSFEVERGEVVGIIGRNGAGKSTLLKVLTRITEPTEGRAELNGRVGSLLEVGTGFHPELTGRENVYLSGNILGMSKKEIDKKFDEIVDFSGIEKFIDTPVKRYSSGMRVRLGFAVAAHLEPEILLIDEVLAVGDAAFQKKCLGKMGDVAREGRTVLFVSHNMAAIENLCQHGMVLDQGRIRYIGSQTEAVAQYLKSSSGDTPSLRGREERKGSGELRVIAIEIRDSQGRQLDTVRSGQDVDIYLHYELMSELGSCDVVGIGVKTKLGVPVFLHHNRLTRDEFGVLPRRGAFVCRLKKVPLPASTYQLGYSVMKDGGRSYIDSVEDACSITVVEGDYYGTGEVPPASHGCCLIEAEWRLEPVK